MSAFLINYDLFVAVRTYVSASFFVMRDIYIYWYIDELIHAITWSPWWLMRLCIPSQYCNRYLSSFVKYNSVELALQTISLQSFTYNEVQNNLMGDHRQYWTIQAQVDLTVNGFTKENSTLQFLLIRQGKELMTLHSYLTACSFNTESPKTCRFYCIQFLIGFVLMHFNLRW